MASKLPLKADLFHFLFYSGHLLIVSKIIALQLINNGRMGKLKVLTYRPGPEFLRHWIHVAVISVKRQYWSRFQHFVRLGVNVWTLNTFNHAYQVN